MREHTLEMLMAILVDNGVHWALVEKLKAFRNELHDAKGHT